MSPIVLSSRQPRFLCGALSSKEQIENLSSNPPLSFYHQGNSLRVGMQFSKITQQISSRAGTHPPNHNQNPRAVSIEVTRFRKAEKECFPEMDALCRMLPRPPQSETGNGASRVLSPGHE